MLNIILFFLVLSVSCANSLFYISLYVVTPLWSCLFVCNIFVKCLFNLNIPSQKGSVLILFMFCGHTNDWWPSTVNSAYNGSAYKELSVIRNWFSFPDLYLSLFYVKIYGYSGFGYKELSLRSNSFSCPNAYKSSRFRSLSRNPLLVKFAPRRLITR